MSTATKKLITRPPVVVVMGHIDHGKSTLLDYIRKTNTTSKEAGGITQHISAYEAECEIGGQIRKITFLDTPGHEAFCTLRERGADVADIAILVVSAEDGVKPQTIEALNCIKKDDMPYIVAINKIDKVGANIDKIKQNLAENNVLLEGWGGTVPSVAISAKTGENVSELLELIALQSDIEELKGDPKIEAEGVVIESDLNPQQGISATLIIKNGTLKIGTFVYTNWTFAKVKTIENYKGESIKEASFSSPVRIVGWSAMPSVGSNFKTFLSKEEGDIFATENKKGIIKEEAVIQLENRATFGVIIKADTFGSLDALENEIKKISTDKILVKIISKNIGAITEQDIKTAHLKKSLILGFNVSANKNTEELALRNNTEIKTYKIIYELLDYLKEKVKEATPVETIEKVTGSAKIIKIFNKNKNKQVIGGKVLEGEIKGNSLVKILRRENLIGEGKIKELQSQKIKTDSVSAEKDFGMMIESKIELIEGDRIEVISWVKE